MKAGRVVHPLWLRRRDAAQHLRAPRSGHDDFPFLYAVVVAAVLINLRIMTLSANDGEISGSR